MKRLLIVALAVALAASSTALLSAQTPKPVPALGVDTLLDARAKTVSSRLRCPVCQGESIQDSPAELSAQMRTLVREQIVKGKTDAEIFDYFVQKYGQWILLEPKAEGINLIVYWVPVLFLLAGGLGLWMVVRRWTHNRNPDEPLPTSSAE